MSSVRVQEAVGEAPPGYPAKWKDNPGSGVAVVKRRGFFFYIDAVGVGSIPGLVTAHVTN